MGAGIEVVTKALGMLDIKVDAGPSNTTINPAPVIATRQNVFSKKSDDSLSHIFGVKEFFMHFPAENFTHLRTHRLGYSKPSQKDTTTSEETHPQHKSEPIPEEKSKEPVEGKTALGSETSLVTDVVEEVSSSSTSTESLKKEDALNDLGKEAVTHAVETVGDSVAGSAQGEEEEHTEEYGGMQQQKAEAQVESTKNADTPLQPSSVDVEAKKETPHPPEITIPVEVEVEKTIETHQTPSFATKSLGKPTEETQITEVLLATKESKNVSEQTVRAEEEQEAVIKVDSKIEDLPELAAKVNLTDEEKDIRVAPDVEEDKNKPAADTQKEVIKKKKKTSEPEKNKKEIAEKNADAKQGDREKTADTLETYSQFTQRVNAEKKNDSKLLPVGWRGDSAT